MKGVLNQAGLRCWLAIVALLAILTTGCSSSDTAPSPRYSVAGDWVGQYQVTTCHSMGGDFRHCGVQDQGGPYNVRLRLSQNGSAVTGTAELDSAFTYQYPAQLSVAGQLDSNGRLTLSGAADLVPPVGGITVIDRVELAGWTTTTEARGQTMTGTFSEHLAGFYGFPTSRFTSQLDSMLLSLTKQ